LVENIEQRLDKFFGLRGYPHEFVEIDLDSLLRGDEKTRIETLVRATQGGIYSPDEARHHEDLPSVPGGWGIEPRVQQQVLPLSAAASISASPLGPAPAVPPAPPAAGQPAAEASGRPQIRKITRLTAREEAEAIERLIREEAARRRPPMGSA
jgi:hypothetical protein